ncbi:ComEA family DNA-binding protein [Dactylosporangium cerinum]|uniref:ComEA family DNA-binding protein n=1 Tax=Dactylosporangium cerinum TaxID=1434730 RepID=A0ABV9W1R6_9ACTN
MLTAPDRPPNPGAQLSWRVLHSWWLLLPILGSGCLGGIGFIYIGLRARRPSWWIPGIGYLLLGCGSFTIFGQVSTTSAASDWAFGVVFAGWIAGIVHACLINSSWLQWQAHHVPWYAQPTAPPPTWPAATPFAPSAFAPPAFAPPAFPPTSVPLPPTMQVQPGTYYAPAPPVVDVNTATAEELARLLPGFDLDRAHQLVAERQARSGFTSVDEFAFAAGLAPHQFAPLRTQMTCSPPTPPTGHAPQGRVLDV